MTKYEAVRAKIVEACHELEQYETVPCPDGMVGCCVHHQRKVYTPARLSHVLRAIRKQPVPIHWVAVDCFGDFLDMEHEWKKDMALCNGINWSLTKDDLSLQSPDTIDFLFKILCE